MKKYKLSVLIPARNEEWLAKTVQDLLEHTSDETEIIVGLDGQWTDPAVGDDPRVTVVYVSESIGQRALTNMLCRLSSAKYVAKVDAHCSFDQDWDIKMLKAFEKTGDNVTMVSIMRNLHVFDWICPDGHSRYQGPSGPCKECGKETKKDVKWIGKKSPQSKSYCFDSEPHFQYFGEHMKKKEVKEAVEKGDLTETMSLQGSCFMMTRDKYWELKICDEDTFPSWGSQGIEVSVKTWLSGGKVLVNHDTWYAHCFRTQGGDFGFPYPQSGSSVQKAKHIARDLFFNNKWEQAIHPLSWLVEKFWPVKGWTDEDLAKLKEMEGVSQETPKIIKGQKGAIFYTDNQLKLKIAHAVQKQLRKISKEKGIPIVSASLKPMPHFGDRNIHLPLKRGYLTYFTQILSALEASESEYIFFLEHDCWYPPEHFDFTPPTNNKFYYNVNWWRAVLGDSKIRQWKAPQVSGLCCHRDLALNFYRNRLKELESGVRFDRKYEPAGGDKSLLETWESIQPYIDIRHSGTLTRDKMSIKDFRDKSTCIAWKEGNINGLQCYDILNDGGLFNQK